MPIAVRTSKASDPTVFTKTVDSDTATAGDTLTYSIAVTNGQMAGPITVNDSVPAGATFVAASETESVVGGTTTTPWTYDGGSNSLSWTGELDVAELQITPDPLGSPAGYLPLSNFVAPLASGCNGNCDDGGYFFNVPPFTFNGTTYSSMIFSVNGTLEPGGASGVFTSFANQNLPDSLAPNNILAPFWRDLDQSSGGEMYIAVLSGGGAQWTIYEWEAVPHWGGTDTVTMQVWIGNNGTPVEGDIHYTYGNMDNPAAGGTVGAENDSGTVGVSYFYDGTGTAPVAGDELRVSNLAGGSANLGFQVTTDCSEEIVINEANVSNAGNNEVAIAVTSCE
jgi:uncharacterized repeat protein (TIGR01451 family)